MTILIVDDEFRIGQLIRRLIHFEELGLELIDVWNWCGGHRRQGLHRALSL